MRILIICFVFLMVTCKEPNTAPVTEYWQATVISEPDVVDFPTSEVGDGTTAAVNIEVKISTKGTPLIAKYLGGPLALKKNSENFTLACVFQPAILEGDPVEETIQIIVKFDGSNKSIKLLTQNGLPFRAPLSREAFIKHINKDKQIYNIENITNYGDKFLEISGYQFELPNWWNSIEVAVPNKLKSVFEIQKYVRSHYGNDTGTGTTWKEALKIYAIKCHQLNIFPIFIAHCYISGEEYSKAIKIYTDLYNLAYTQAEDKNWYECYLAYNAGITYIKIHDKNNAKIWLSRSAEHHGKPGSAISYYSNKAAKALREL